MSDHNDALLKQELTGKILPLLTRAQQIATSEQLTTIDSLTSHLFTLNQQTVEQIKSAQLDLRIVAQKVLNQWNSVIIDTVVNNASLSNSNQFQFKQDVIGNIMPLLITNQSHASNKQLSLLGIQFPVQVETIIKNIPLLNEHFATIKQDITGGIMPLLSTGQQDVVDNLMRNNPEQLRQHLTTLQTYSDEQTYI